MLHERMLYYKNELKLIWDLRPIDWVYLEAYDYCKQNNLATGYVGKDIRSLVRDLGSFSAYNLPEVGEVLFNVHTPEDRDGACDEVIAFHPGRGFQDITIGLYPVLHEYWHHRYTVEDSLKFEATRKDNLSLEYRYSFSDGTVLNVLAGIPVDKGELFKVSAFPKEILYTFAHEKFRALFTYSGELRIIWSHIVMGRIGVIDITDPITFVKLHPTEASKCFARINDILLDDEFVRYNILERRYFVQKHFTCNGAVDTV